jgi:MFS family permease
MFKPVVISTVARCTTDRTASMGFGVFYMMVNVGGFIGPIIAGVVRGWSWNYVFLASAIWIVMLGLTCAAFYKEPPIATKAKSGPETESKAAPNDEKEPAAKAKPKQLDEVLRGMVAVVGNGRFFTLVVGLLAVLVMGSKWWDFTIYAPVAAGWLVFNLVLDAVLRAKQRSLGAPPRSWLLQPMSIGEGRYMLFLVLMAGFWTSFNQIFMTLPEYIRDYADTRDLVSTLGPVAGSISDGFAAMGVDTSAWGKAVLEEGQVKPEHLINLNAFGIIVGQILISFIVRRFQPLSTIINGVVVTIISFLIFLTGQSGTVIVIAILVFSVGEMMASPKAKEYAGRIAPPEKVGMYMGYFFWCTALGNLFGGLLSGVMYGHFGPKGIDRPDIMWAIFAALAGTTAVSLKFYDRWIRSKTAPAQDSSSSSGAKS